MKNWKSEILGAVVLGAVVSAVVLFLLKSYIFSIILFFIFLFSLSKLGHQLHKEVAAEESELDAENEEEEKPINFFSNTPAVEMFFFYLLFFCFTVGLAFWIYSDFFFGDLWFFSAGTTMVFGSLLLVTIAVVISFFKK